VVRRQGRGACALTGSVLRRICLLGVSVARRDGRVASYEGEVG